MEDYASWEASLTRKKYIEHLAYGLDQCIYEAYIAQRGLDIDAHFFSSTIAWFKEMVIGDNAYGITFSEVLNYQSYNRYFGTFANIIELMVFNPWLFTSESHSTQCYHLSSRSVYDIVYTTFSLIVYEGMDVTIHDFYNMTPVQHLMISRSEENKNMPPHIRSAIDTFYVLYRDGNKVVDRMQQRVRMWLRRKHAKEAVRKIEDWWFEIVNSPYTRCGRRMIDKRSARWYAMITY